MPRADKITSNRRAKLRVVGAELDTTRHAALIEFEDGHCVRGKCILEVTTFAEFDRLPPALRPGKGLVIPGIGWMTLRRPLNDEEAEDVKDVQRQTYELWFNS